MSIPIRIGRKWQGRTRKTGFPSVSENFDSYEDANNFIIKTKASMLSLKHNGVRDVRKMTIGSLIDGYMEEHEGVPFGKNKTAVLKTLKRDLGDISPAFYRRSGHDVRQSEEEGRCQRSHDLDRKAGRT
jgi:hypothetical protein